MSRITLRKVKYLASMSKETHCYTADIYFDGVKVGTVENDGHGSEDYAMPLSHVKRVGAEITRVDINRAEWDAMQKHIATYDVVTVSGTSDSMFQFIPTLETITADLMNDYCMLKELKRLTAKRVVYTIKGKKALYQTNCAPDARHRNAWVEQITKRPDTSQVLNTMPIADAVALFSRLSS